MSKKKKHFYTPKNEPSNQHTTPKVDTSKKSSNVVKKVKKFAIYVGIVVVIILLVLYFKGVSAKNNEFTQCLADTNATLYGASWCTACNQQKNILGNSKNIPYVECSDPNDSNAQTQVCIDEGISGYPTWKFADGAQRVGVLDKKDLAIATGCLI